jgi:hypothetical protein
VTGVSVSAIVNSSVPVWSRSSRSSSDAICLSSVAVGIPSSDASLWMPQ